MARAINGQDALITRDQYNNLKRMDRNAAENFIRGYYEKGYTKGVKDTENRYKAERENAAAVNNKESRKIFKDEFLSTLTNVHGFGAATLKKIQDAFDRWIG